MACYSSVNKHWLFSVTFGSRGRQMNWHMLLTIRFCGICFLDILRIYNLSCFVLLNLVTVLSAYPLTTTVSLVYIVRVIKLRRMKYTGLVSCTGELGHTFWKT